MPFLQHKCGWSEGERGLLLLSKVVWREILYSTSTNSRFTWAQLGRPSDVILNDSSTLSSATGALFTELTPPTPPPRPPFLHSLFSDGGPISPFLLLEFPYPLLLFEFLLLSSRYFIHSPWVLRQTFNTYQSNADCLIDWEIQKPSPPFNGDLRAYQICNCKGHNIFRSTKPLPKPYHHSTNLKAFKTMSTYLVGFDLDRLRHW